MQLEPGHFDRLVYATAHLAEAAACAKEANDRGEVTPTDFVVLRRCLLKALRWIPEEHI